MTTKVISAFVAFFFMCAGGCASYAGEGPDYAQPPKSDGPALGAPPGNEAKIVDPLRWLTPQGGETFCLEGAYPLMWTGGGDDLVQFLLIRMDIWTVVPGAPAGDFDNDGRETWTVPDYVKPGDYEMYVQREDRTDWRYSATFAVKDCGCPVKGGG